MDCARPKACPSQIALTTLAETLIERRVAIREYNSALVALLIGLSIFRRAFSRKCSCAVIKGIGTCESSKGSSSTSLNAFLTIWLGCPSVDLRYFRFQDILLCCQAGSCLLQYGNSIYRRGFSTNLSFLYRITEISKVLYQR